MVILDQDDFNSCVVKKFIKSSLLDSLYFQYIFFLSRICESKESYIRTTEYILKNNITIVNQYYNECVFNNRIAAIEWLSLFSNLLVLILVFIKINRNHRLEIMILI